MEIILNLLSIDSSNKNNQLSNDDDDYGEYIVMHFYGKHLRMRKQKVILSKNTNSLKLMYSRELNFKTIITDEPYKSNNFYILYKL